MRRLSLLLAGGAVWLFLAAVPVFADNGPHIASVNSGATGINADSCAGCHRAHTAQGAMLLIEEEPAMCLVCHGATGAGASTDVVSGIQYAATDRSGGVVGALRSGGFTQARIGSGAGVRLSYQVPSAGRGFTGLVPVASTGTAVTSRHMNLDGTAWGPSIAWGNETVNSFPTTPYPGPVVSISCTTCHNPHGNGRYRILNPVPAPAVSTGYTFVPAPVAANVTDVATVATGQVRNYTNPPVQYVSQLGTAGTPDYWRYCTPWNNCSGANRGDKPNDLPSGPFSLQITAWCSTCHTRYLAGGGSAESGFNTGDGIYNYRHTTSARPECTQCHVAHGSNAVMDGAYSGAFPYPGGVAVSGSSRLLKLDNRGTCQMCHDPTGTVTAAGVQTP